MDKIKSLFQESDREKFDKQRLEILKTYEDTTNEEIMKLIEYLGKYQENLSLYLEKGVEKTTSLLEQMNQRMKKISKNNRGGH